MKCYLLLLYSTQIPYCYSMVSYLTMLILGTWMTPNSVFLLLWVCCFIVLTWFPLIASKMYLKLFEKKSKSKNALGLISRETCVCVWMEYSMCACHFLLLSKLWIIFEMWSNFKKWKWGMGFCLLVWTQCYTIFCEWCNMTKHFTSKFKMYNCLIILKKKSHVAFKDVLAVTNARPSIF